MMVVNAKKQNHQHYTYSCSSIERPLTCRSVLGGGGGGVGGEGEGFMVNSWRSFALQLMQGRCVFSACLNGMRTIDVETDSIIRPFVHFMLHMWSSRRDRRLKEGSQNHTSHSDSNTSWLTLTFSILRPDSDLHRDPRAKHTSLTH